MKLIVLWCLLSFVVGVSARTLEGKETASKSNDAKSAVEKGGSGETEPFLDKIVGGSDAQPGEIPWQASVKTLDLIDGVWQFTHVCGATIISEYWLLSAAHCFIYTPKWKWQVAVGEIHLSKKDPDEQVFEVESIHNHELYGKEKPDDYDVALIKIKPLFDGRGIKFSTMVNFTCVLSYVPLKVNTTLLISGWGGLKRRGTTESSEYQTYPDVLQGAVVPLIDQRVCQQKYPCRITDRMFCAGYPDGEIDTCQGDSGGPVVYTEKGINVLYGVVSWGYGCAQANLPGVYARVTEFVGWIKNTTSVHGDNPRQSRIPCLG